MTYAIETKYFGPGNVRGARIRVKSYWGTKFYDYDHAARDAHVAALELALANMDNVRDNMKRVYNYSDNVNGDGIVALVWHEDKDNKIVNELETIRYHCEGETPKMEWIVAAIKNVIAKLEGEA